MGINRDQQLAEIREILQSDLTATDLKISLFVSAAQCYKKNFLLNPFPTNYLDGENKHFERLLEDLEQIPPIDELVVMMMAGTITHFSSTALDIIHWILTKSKFEVKTVPKSRHDEVLSLAKNTVQKQLPNQIFKVSYNNSSGAERKYQLLSQGMPKKFAYHGTKFYNVYTILNYGLQQHLNKTGLFGEGLYFAFELQISALFSPSVLSWNKSRIGNLMSCVALCEYIDDPMHYKIQKENSKVNDIPQNYLLITNNEIVRVRYLLTYGSKKTSIKPSLSKDGLSTLADPQIESISIFTWCRRNPLIVSAIFYVVLLVLIGVNQNRSVEHYKNILKDFFKRRLRFE